MIAAWRGVLAQRAWVVSRDEAVAEGWFGLVEPSFLPRIGDVVVAPCGPWAVIASKTEPRESAMVGLHGSLTTQSDQLVPLLTIATGRVGLSADAGRLSTGRRGKRTAGDTVFHRTREVIHSVQPL